MRRGRPGTLKLRPGKSTRLQEKLRNILSANTGQDLDKIALDTDRDYYLTSDGAVEYGLVDEILGVQPESAA